MCYKIRAWCCIFCWSCWNDHADIQAGESHDGSRVIIISIPGTEETWVAKIPTDAWTHKMENISDILKHAWQYLEGCLDALTTDEGRLQRLTKYFLWATGSSVADARKLMKRLKSTEVKIQDPDKPEQNSMGGKHIRSLGGKHDANYILWAKDITAPAGQAPGVAFVGSNDLLMNAMVASRSLIGTSQKCYDWKGIPTINKETLSLIFGVVVSGIKDEHWRHIKEKFMAGRKGSMTELNKLRQETLDKVGQTETSGLPEMLQKISCSSEPARIMGYGLPASGSSSSSNNQAPIYIRASQAPVKSKLEFHIDSNRIITNKLPEEDRWMEEVHEV